MGKLTASIPEDLHQRVRDEVAADETLTISMVVQRAIEAYYSKGASQMNENTKTLAFQIPQELFDRIQDYLAAQRQQTGRKLTQKGFIVGLIEQALVTGYLYLPRQPQSPTHPWPVAAAGSGGRRPAGGIGCGAVCPRRLCPLRRPCRPLSVFNHPV